MMPFTPGVSIAPRPKRTIQGQENSDPTKLQGIAGGIRILMPEEVTKVIIGKAGQNVQRLGRESGTIINVSAVPFITVDQCTDHIVSIIPRVLETRYESPMHQCTKAMTDVVTLAFNLDASLGQVETKVILLVDAQLAGLIIGRSGARKKQIEDTYQVVLMLTMPPPGQADEEVCFSGTLYNIALAIASLDDIFKIQINAPPSPPLSPPMMQQPGGKGGYADPYWQQHHGGPGTGGELAIPRVDGSSKSREYVLKVPPLVDAGAFIGKGGKFMQELKKNAKDAGGFVFKLHLGDDPNIPGEKQLEVTSTDTVAWYVMEMCMRRFHLLEETQPRQVPNVPQSELQGNANGMGNGN